MLDKLSDNALCKGLRLIEPSDKILVKLAEDIGIQFNYDSVLTPEQRLALIKKCLAREELLLNTANHLRIQFEYNGSEFSHRSLVNKCLTRLSYDSFDTALLFEIREEVKKPRDKMTKEEIDILGIQVDYDGSRLTPEQRRALFKSYWPIHLKMIGLRSPQYYVQYYREKSKCLSVSETAWPGTLIYLDTEKLKRCFIDPEDLIKRLSKLKPSDNFELRKFRHPPIE